MEKKLKEVENAFDYSQESEAKMVGYSQHKSGSIWLQLRKQTEFLGYSQRSDRKIPTKL